MPRRLASPFRRVPLLLVGFISLLLLISVRFVVFANPDPVRAALELARQSGGYHFSADIVQYTDPTATICNAGRTSQREDMHMQGQTDLRTRLLEMPMLMVSPPMMTMVPMAMAMALPMHRKTCSAPAATLIMAKTPMVMV